VVFRQDPTSPFSKAGPAFARITLATLTIVFVGWLALTIHRQEGNARLSARNFYGVLRVLDGRMDPVPAPAEAKAASPEGGRYRRLVNGTVDHGLEFLAADRRDEPTTYYSPNSGIGVALRAIEGRKRLRVGAIGLGAGTIAIYGHAGDHYTFYEINPLDIDIAGRWFHFLGDSKANIDVVRGDARLSLEREPPQRFDVLAVDAFTGDSIPVHLLTLQAFQLYFRQLQPAGVLAVHISNRSLNLQPVVGAAAAKLGKEAVRISNPPDYRKEIYKSVWILLGSRQGFLGRGAIERAGRVLSPSPGDRLWTDDYSSLFSVLK
jgi:SAM-dependent methyltransferase